MSLKNFRAYQLSLQFYWVCTKLRTTRHLQDQLHRASSSISLNLSEGSAKPTPRDRGKYYFIALGSIRECETILDLLNVPEDSDSKKIVNELGAVVYQLCKAQKLQILKETKSGR